MPVAKVCEKCGAGFTVPLRRSEQVKFCSLACKHAAGRVALSCSVCHKQFERKVSDIRGAEVFCSRECYDSTKAGRVQPVKEDAPKYIRVCETCKTTFSVTKTRSETARFCSIKCKADNPAWRQECSERELGDKHWRWDGGKYKAGPYRLVHADGETKRAHRLLFAKHMADRAPGHPFLKQEDGEWKLHTNIHVHHIDRDPQNNAIENLLAVTIQAHARIHHHGRKPAPWECWPPNPEVW